LSRPELFVPPVVLDRASAIPLYRQIYRQIAQAILGGAIHREARLPSTRVMARLLRVSRNTVLAAYEDLAADDLVRGERGAGVRVHRGAAAPDMTLYGLRRVIRAASYPARVVTLADPDGNPFYIHF
jgi:DNA-binding transcriptional regulator YhcF (GntR family)